MATERKLSWPRVIVATGILVILGWIYTSFGPWHKLVVIWIICWIIWIMMIILILAFFNGAAANNEPHDEN